MANGNASIPAVPDGEEGREVIRLVKEGRTIEAIKRVREITGCGLKEGKDAVERIAADLAGGAPLPSGVVPIEAIRQLLHSGQMIEAVKVYRNALGCGLKDAKDAVDRIAAGH